MICISCGNDFDNIDGLKFCPYCGKKILEPGEGDTEQDPDFIENGEENINNGEEVKTKDLHDTLEMPAITEEDIKKYNRDKIFKSFIKIFTKMKIVIPVVTFILVASVGVFAYSFLTGNSVDEERIKGDLIGKTVTLPKGTNIEIKKGYIKSLTINSRTTSKSEKKDDITVGVTINNGSLEVKSLLSIQYIYEGKNRWVFSNNVGLAGEPTIKPLVAMEEKQFLDELKKLSINIGDISKSLGAEDVKSIKIVERAPDFEKLKEVVLVETVIDNGLLAATGKLKCKLNFEEENWKLASMDRNSNEDFGLVLSSAFTPDKVVELIRKEGLEETVTHPNVFSGKGFYIKDSFTKGINIGDKKFDAQKGVLSVTAKRENSAGELKSQLSTDYSFSLSFSKIEFLKKSKTTVESVAIDDMSKDFIISTLANVEIEGANTLFWFSDNHKITPAEAKTLKVDKILSKKGLLNVKYVYGSITYTEGKKEKTTSFVAPYFLVYDSSKGYNWKLDRIVGSDSPNYRNYSQ